MRTFLRRLSTLSLLLAALPVAAAAQAPVPLEFQDLYWDLASSLETFAAVVPPAWAIRPVDFSAELSSADANRLDDLLAPNSLVGTMLALDHLAAAGPEAVTVNISYPMLHPSFHRDAREYARYLGFYKTVARAARLRGLKLIVKSGALMATDPRVVGFYRSVRDVDTYKAGRLAVARTIVREIAPDYLTLQAEPDVEESQTGQPVGSVDGAFDLVSFLVSGLRGGGDAGTSLGAGGGTWHSDFYDLEERLLSIRELGYLDLHVYPINRDFLFRALAAADRAAAAGKDVAMSEAWLYKVRDGELPWNGPLLTDILARDVFSFWEPLDRRYVEVLVRLAVAKGFAFVSLFWSKYLFSYLDYADTWFLPPDQLFALSQSTSTQAMLNDRLSGTGRTYQALIGYHSWFER